MTDDSGWDTAHRPAGRSRLLLAMALLGAAVLAWSSQSTGLAGNVDTDPDELPIVRASEPLVVPADGRPLVRQPTATSTGGWLCRPPFTLAAYASRNGRLAFPAGHAGQPPQTVQPDACYASTDEAISDSYRLAAMPVGDRRVDGVYLRDIGGDLREDCQAAADQLGHAVPCPATVPVDRFSAPSACGRSPAEGGLCVVDEPEARGMLLRDSTVALPAGVFERSGPGSVRPLVFTLSAAAAANPVSRLVGCAPDDHPIDGPLRDNLIVTCRAGQVWNGSDGYPHAFRQTQRWRYDDRVDVAISLSVAAVDVGLARQAIAEDLYWVEPGDAER